MWSTDFQGARALKKKSSPEDMIIDFRERGEREREKEPQCEKETLISCLPYTPQLESCKVFL